MAPNFKLIPIHKETKLIQFVELLKTKNILSFGLVIMEAMVYMDKYIKRMDKKTAWSLKLTVVKATIQRWEYSQMIVL